MSVKNDGNNIVLNKINTSAALQDYKHSISSMIFFTFACKGSSYLLALDRSYFTFDYCRCQL